MKPEPNAPTSTLPYRFASAHGVVLVEQTDGQPACLYRDDMTLDAMMEVQRFAGVEVSFHATNGTVFDATLRQVYRDNATEAAQVAAETDEDLAALADSAAEIDDLLDQRDDAPVIRLINALFLEAIREKASDIHIDVQENRLTVRFRVDGVLRDVLEPRRALAPQLISRTKVMARLDISEKRLPQDGRVSLRVGGHEIDVRVSTIPAQYGERVVMRILERDGTRLGLDGFGMTPRDHGVFEQMLSRPNGIFLVTGPTGSGKTTTLYAALAGIDRRERNVMTVEDPIEYAIPGIAQTQVNPRTDLTFARGLRAILRQDPDIIMVGEIRDRETASTAVQAAMTGHFVLSTLHTNSALGAITRLIDMGVERFLLAPMLTGVMAQRLVRLLCPACRIEYKASAADRTALFGRIKIGTPVFRPVGCPACRGTGYRGRTGIYEVVAIDRALETMIHDGAAEADLVSTARTTGPSLLDDGVRRVLAGETSVAEVARAVQDM